MIRMIHIISIMLLTAIAFAEEESSLPEKPWDLDDLLVIAEDRNPDIAVAKAGVKRAEANLREARAYPNPSVEFSREEVGLDNRQDGMSMVTLRQPVITGKRRAAAVEAAAYRAEAAAWELQRVRQKVARDVHLLWAEMIYLEEKNDVDFEMLNISSKTLSQAEGDASGSDNPDVLRARVTNTEDELTITMNMAERVYTSQDLDLILGGVGVRPSDIDGDLETRIIPERISAATDEVVVNHPMVQMLEMIIQSKEEEERRARSENTPDVTVGITGGYSHTREESIGGVGIRIPIPLWDRNRGEQEAWRQAAVQEQAHLEDARLRIRTGWEKALQMVNEYDTMVTEYRRSILPSMNKALEQATERYEAGTIDFDDYLDVQRRHHRVHRLYLDYLLRLNEAYAQIRWLNGE